MRVQKIPLERFHEKFAVQLNDTHPAIAVAELMRLLVDEHALRVGARLGHHAPDLRVHQPHAAARSARALAGRAVRPACCRAISRSSTRSTRASWTKCASAFFGDEARIARLSLIDEHGERYVRMAHLACVGSHAINGVAAAALRAAEAATCCSDFHELWPREVLATRPTASRRGAGWCSRIRASRAASPRRSARTGSRDLERAARARAAAPTTRLSRALWRAIKRANKDELAALVARAHRHRRRSRTRCSTCRSSASTSTSAST